MVDYVEKLDVYGLYLVEGFVEGCVDYCGSVEWFG